MKLRRFNEQGIKEFRSRLAGMRDNPQGDVPTDLLEHRQFTEIVQPEIQIAAEHFETKGEAARYLSSVLGKLNPEEVATDAGLWTWLSLLYFDSVCPMANGGRTVRNDYHYIFLPRQMRYFYRHLLFVAWQILRLAPTHNRMFLRSKVYTLDSVTDQVMKRLYLTRIPAFFEILDRLYWDDTRKRPKPGITGQKISAGSLRHRLPIRIRQLEKTYDLMSLNADQLIDLLGDEFSFARPKTAKLFDEVVH